MHNLGKKIYEYGQHTWHQNIYIVALYISYLVLGMSYVGIHYWTPTHEDEIQEFIKSFIKYYIAAILILRFNPYVKRPEHSSFDRQIAFSAGIMLLIVSGEGIFTFVGNLVGGIL
jgi:hypothetical protein